MKATHLVGGALVLGLAGCGSARALGASSADAVDAPALVGVDRSTLPPAGPRPAWEPPSVETWTMSNGMVVWYLRRPHVPLVDLEFILPTGAASDPPGKSGLTGLMIDLLDEGAGASSPAELSAAFQRLAADYFAWVTIDGTRISLSGLADQLEPSLALLADVLRRPALAPEEFDRRKAHHLVELGEARADPTNIARRIAMRVLFGDYAGRSPRGSRQTVERITVGDVRDHYSAMVQPSGATLIAIGAIERASLEAALSDAFGDWSGTPRAMGAVQLDGPAPRVIHAVDLPGTGRATLVLARRGPGQFTDDYAGALTFAAVLGVRSDGRLDRRLRADVGDGSDVYSGFRRWGDAGAFTITAAVEASKIRASLDAIFDELGAVRGERPVTPAERNAAVDMLVGGLPAAFVPNRAAAWIFSTIAREGHAPSWIRTWRSRIAAVPVDEVRAAARHYADPLAVEIIVVGDLARLRPQLEGLGLDITLYDPEGQPLAVD